jgi:colicin import membrane protein
VKFCERHLVTGTTSGIPGGLKKAATTVSGRFSTKKARVTAAAVTGTVVLAAGTLTAVGVHAANVTDHKKQVAAQELTVRLTAEKAAADKASADKAAADQAAADQAAKAAVDKAAADKAAADAAAKAAADKAAADKAAADKAAADKAAAARAAAAAQANRDAQRTPITPSPTKAPTKAPTTSPAPVAAYGSPKAIAQSIVPAGQFGCFSTIIQRESGWNVHATNPSSGAYGLGQALPASKMASAGSDWQNNPETQIRWALSYMDGRYGSPCGALSFWNGHGWY